MTETETLRLVGEVIGVLVLFGGGVLWIIRNIWKVLHEVQANTGVTTELKDHMKAMNGSVAKHYVDDATRFEEIKVELARIEGRLDGHNLGEVT